MRLSHIFSLLLLVVVRVSSDASAGSRSTSEAQAQTTTTQWAKIHHAVGTFSDMVLGRHSGPYSSRLKQQGLSVIGAGFPRTGTKSIEAALVSLGHRIYDPRSVLEHKHETRWIAAAQGWKIHNDLTELESLVADMEAAGYTATLDIPAFMLAEPLSKIRPSAKVLLSVRDSVDQWIRSFSLINEIIGPLMYCRPWIWFVPSMKFIEPILTLILGLDPFDATDNPEHVDHVFPWYDNMHTTPTQNAKIRQEWITAYDAHRQQVIDAVAPEERLLVFNVKQGWAPLIPFLEVDVDDPEVAAIIENGFPHVNDRATLEFVRMTFKVLGFGFPFWVLFLVIALSLCLWFLLQTVKVLIWKPKNNTDKRKTD